MSIYKKIRILAGLRELQGERSALLKLCGMEEVVQEEDGWKEWLSGSAVTEPVYHGTDASFSVEKMKGGDGALGWGYYFTPNEEVAKGYGGNIIKAWVKLTNPLIIEVNNSGLEDPCVKALEKLGVESGKASKTVERLYDTKGYVGKQIKNLGEGQGYDGIIFKNDLRTEIVVWNKHNIRG